MWFSRQVLALRYRDAFVPSFIALTYVLLGYSSGLFLLLQGNIALWLLGTLLLAHALTIAAYLIHDLTHNALFARPETNERLGLLLAWLTGACYSNYRELRRSHMRHHVQRMDVVAVDYKAWLKKHPVLRRTVEILEWCYLPAVDLMMHGLVIVAPFVFPGHAHRRWYVLKTLLIRICLFTILFLISPSALLGYALAYVLMIHVLRFMDMHQHTYDVAYGSTDGHARPDAEFEQQNTYSNPLGRSALLNLLVLNFGYHNAHHEQPTVPWYRLPELHRSLYGDSCEQQLSAKDLLRNMHKYRVSRVMSETTADGDRPGFSGLYGVSFLTVL